MITFFGKWYLKMILKAFDIIPISKAMDDASIQVVVDALNNNEVVALFPERYLCSNGQMGAFHADFEKILARVTARDVNVIPFYIRGLWGTGAVSYTHLTLPTKRIV